MFRVGVIQVNTKVNGRLMVSEDKVIICDNCGSEYRYKSKGKIIDKIREIGFMLLHMVK
ncbi:MAG: hypothetical protein ACRDDY_07965 [Clostridium sp.]|uniref:hypothetical protein n=1 Tax=Clostridium sp. TaxID=1506 RepID=UPI003EE5756C